MKKFIIPAILGFFAVITTAFIIAGTIAAYMLGQDNARDYYYDE